MTEYVLNNGKMERHTVGCVLKWFCHQLYIVHRLSKTRQREEKKLIIHLSICYIHIYQLDGMYVGCWHGIQKFHRFSQYTTFDYNNEVGYNMVIYIIFWKMVYKWNICDVNLLCLVSVVNWWSILRVESFCMENTFF